MMQQNAVAALNNWNREQMSTNFNDGINLANKGYYVNDTWISLHIL